MWPSQLLRVLALLASAAASGCRRQEGVLGLTEGNYSLQGGGSRDALILKRGDSSSVDVQWESCATIHATDQTVVNIFGDVWLPSSVETIGGSLTFAGHGNGRVGKYGDLRLEVPEGARMAFRDMRSSGSGGCLYIGGKLQVNNSGEMNFVNCSADSGGGIYARGNTTVNNSGKMSFTKCSARYGGSVYTLQSMEVSNSGEITFANCSADDSGGGICTYGSMEVNNSGETDLANCSADYKGGGIYHDGNMEVVWARTHGCDTRRGSSCNDGVYCNVYATQSTDATSPSTWAACADLCSQNADCAMFAYRQSSTSWCRLCTASAGFSSSRDWGVYGKVASERGECGPGEWRLDWSMVCHPCKGGETRRRRANACTECAKGMYNDGSADDCSPCRGCEARRRRADDCNLCVKGEYNNGSADDCSLCPQGTTTQAEGSLQCIVLECPLGFINHSRDADSCVLCAGIYEFIEGYDNVSKRGKACRSCFEAPFTSERWWCWLVTLAVAVMAVGIATFIYVEARAYKRRAAFESLQQSLETTPAVIVLDR